MSIAQRLNEIKNNLPSSVQVVAVSKFHKVSAIEEAYEVGHRIFGESRVQELIPKYNELPKDIQWHFIGHLQSNKVKFIVPFVDMIESVDSLKLLEEINREAKKFDRYIKILLQIHIAQEEHKYGFHFEEVEDLIKLGKLKSLSHIKLVGLMGMASFTDKEDQIRNEFRKLASFYRHLKASYFSEDDSFRELSIGMSDDYPIAIEEGSTLVRIGSKIFGSRE
ncbi:YggS family pyridoxal phosphate-dependent enzyme [Bacteroidales bacterium OttesenSCG-928-M11]|nr:YggS family pyridoxal phosphate-dependent enzyme [Bacteroidales bacterium OttesenSCG-928-M11]